MIRPIATAGLALAAALVTIPAAAADSPWAFRIGAAHVDFSTDATISVNGSVVPGANASASNNTTVGFELSYRHSPRLTTRFLAGIPPTTTLTGTGALDGTGTLGKASYGPAALTLTVDLLKSAPVRPYVGAGVNYTIVTSDKDGFIDGLDVNSAFGTVLEAGVEFDLGPRWFASIDARKIFLKTKADGTLPAMGGAAAHARLTLDPLVVLAAVGWRF